MVASFTSAMRTMSSYSEFMSARDRMGGPSCSFLSVREAPAISTTLEPSGFSLVIFASTKPCSVSGTQIHCSCVVAMEEKAAWRAAAFLSLSAMAGGAGTEG